MFMSIIYVNKYNCVSLYAGILECIRMGDSGYMAYVNLIYLFIFYLFIKTYLYRVVHNQTILILFYSVALFLAKSKSSDN